MANQILVIAPYWLDSVETWVFDDEAVDLVQEPFVGGIPEMIESASDRSLLKDRVRSIYQKVQLDGQGFETAKQERFEADKIRLGGAYRHESLKEILLH